MSPKLRVRQSAVPVSPGCSVGVTWDQSVVPKGMSVIRMALGSPALQEIVIRCLFDGFYNLTRARLSWSPGGRVPRRRSREEIHVRRPSAGVHPTAHAGGVAGAGRP